MLATLGHHLGPIHTTIQNALETLVFLGNRAIQEAIQ